MWNVFCKTLYCMSTLLSKLLIQSRSLCEEASRGQDQRSFKRSPHRHCVVSPRKLAHHLSVTGSHQVYTLQVDRVLLCALAGGRWAPSELGNRLRAAKPVAMQAPSLVQIACDPHKILG